MTLPPLALDHLGAMVRDLEAGAARWRRLGFQLAPKSPQMGYAARGDAEMQPWATANHCAMFRRGYLELIGIHAPGLFNPWARFMDRFEGLHIAAFRCPEADAAYAGLAARGAHVDPPIDRKRTADYGDRPVVRFRNIFSQDNAWPEGRMIVLEHVTPDAMWWPPLLEHPNGAVALAEVVFCAAEPAPTIARLSALLGVAGESRAGRTELRPAQGGLVSVTDEAAFHQRFPGAALPPLPAAAACTVSVEDLGRTRELLQAAGVMARDGDREIWVAPETAGGFVLAFVQA